MKHINNSEIKSNIKLRNEFKANSSSGVIKNSDYIVYSYTTIIYRESDKYFNNSFFSSTTSKLQNILIDIFGFNDGIKKRS